MSNLGERVVKLTKASDDGETDISGRRNRLSEELFGKQDDYFRVPESSKETDTSTATHGTITSKMQWFIVIALTLIAFNWGVWSAIGVFILGAILLNVLGRDAAR